jgi:hypothetical protein
MQNRADVQLTSVRLDCPFGFPGTRTVRHDVPFHIRAIALNTCGGGPEFGRDAVPTAAQKFADGQDTAVSALSQ